MNSQTGLRSSPTDARTTLIVLLILALVTALSIYLQNRSPDVVPENASASEFSAARALQQLRVISARPHPIGSQDHANARDYIVRELSNLGLAPETQRTVAVNTRWGSPFATAMVHNVLVRIPGTNNARAVLLLAHYDSAASSYGASDDGAGVVTLLETARALKASGPLKNDVILLFTDGEEIGLLGASAFTTHPWARDVGVFLNFEARGNSGPVVMFETSTGNSDLIRQFDRAAPHPIASSFFYEIYKRLPNDTDFTVLNATGAQGLNFAYLDGIQHYHTYLDNADTINHGSLQQLGSNALALAKHFGNTDVGPRSVDAVYFNFLGTNLIQYSNAFAIALLVLTFFVFAFLVWKGIKTRQLRVMGIVWGFLALLVAVVVSALTTWAAWWLVMKLRPSIHSIPWSEPYNSNVFRIAFVLLALGVTAAVYTLIRRRTDWRNLMMGSLLWWLILSVAVSVMVPGGSYLFTLPLLFGLIGAGVVLYSSDSEKSRLILGITLLPAVILWAPLIYSVFVALTLNSASTVIVCVALLFGLLIAPVVWSINLWRWFVPGVLVAASIVLIIVGVVSSGFDKDAPRMNNLIYALDANTGKAFFASSDDNPDEWTTQFLSSGVERANMREFFPGQGRPYLRSSATVAQVAGPNASVTGDQTENDVRTLTIRVTSPRGAPVISMYGVENEVLDATVDGKRAFRVGNDRSKPGPPMRNWGVQFYALPAEGVELTIKTKPDKPFKLLVVDRSYGLPEISDATVKPRPDHIIPTPYGLSDVMLVAKTFTF